MTKYMVKVQLLLWKMLQLFDLILALNQGQNQTSPIGLTDFFLVVFAVGFAL